jgi:hypothetical protein
LRVRMLLLKRSPFVHQLNRLVHRLHRFRCKYKKFISDSLFCIGLVVYLQREPPNGGS